MKRIKQFCSLLLAGTILATSLTPMPVSAASQKKNSVGGWYEEGNGSYPANQWKQINGNWYWFNKNGYMATGWQDIGGDWYYFQSSGAMIGQGWHVINGNWFYMYASGAMAADTWIGDSYVNSSGAWIPGKTKVQAGWVQSGNRWWYRHADGSYTKSGWEMIKGQWYLFDRDGWMLTGWQRAGGTWYYLQSSGAMLGQGWHAIDGKWYQMYADGAMASNTWIEGYYVKPSGAMAENNRSYVEISNYLYNYKTLKDALKMQKAEDWQFFGEGESYVADDFYLVWDDSYVDPSYHIFSMKNEGNPYIKLFGIKMGDDFSQATEKLQSDGWKKYTQEDYMKYINGTAEYYIQIKADKEGKVYDWYFCNWPEGDWED